MEEKTSMLSSCEGLLITFCKLTFLVKDCCFASIECSTCLQMPTVVSVRENKKAESTV